tara:strand:+ start:95 stop:568 length:474 start_codon:yes stop_codon:yes gene_type:complete
MKDKFQTNPEVFLYFIKSDFKEILLRLSNKILEECESSLINLENDSDLTEVDKYLWIKDRDNFIPHIIFDENISELDNLVLFKGSYEKMKGFGKFKKLIVSPNVKITKFKFFSRFMLFSDTTLTRDVLKNLKEKLTRYKIKYKIFYEHDNFKWKLVN